MGLMGSFANTAARTGVPGVGGRGKEWGRLLAVTEGATTAAPRGGSAGSA
jgi:hypothetical protein